MQPGSHPSFASDSDIRPIQWIADRLRLLDQRRLPHEEIYVDLATAAETAAAIRDMVVRGAPAIGIAAAYGAVLAARSAYLAAGAQWRPHYERSLDVLDGARPTAVNLRWALDRMRAAALAITGDPEAALLAEAAAIHAQDIAGNRRMGAIGAALIAPAARVLTHCNAGALATGGYGTALGVVRSAHAAGRIATVYAGETRPWLQGARLTAWELLRDGIDVTLLADGAAAWLMRDAGVDWVIVGADRVAANGDTANKIGTYGLAVAARAHGVKFMVVAPASTFDLRLPDGSGIPVENRAAAELASLADKPLAAHGAGVWNPVFDVTPASLIDVIVTERGAIERPDRARIAALLQAPA